MRISSSRTGRHLLFARWAATDGNGEAFEVGGMQGSVVLSFGERADITEVVLELEDAYRRAWESVNLEPNIDQRIPKLQQLERALKGAAAGVVDVARRNGIKIDGISAE
ncbi:hypothetical protein [Streptomyces clavifer]|uniref:hypothetical protein n=1 Tax=Streptomyces clavifer TaxID=68188 RepID=UPI0036634F38